jgi:hypothetical protein
MFISNDCAPLYVLIGKQRAAASKMSREFVERWQRLPAIGKFLRNGSVCRLNTSVVIVTMSSTVPRNQLKKLPANTK